MFLLREISPFQSGLRLHTLEVITQRDISNFVQQRVDVIQTTCNYQDNCKYVDEKRFKME